MATDYFLDIDGIKGESQDSKHPNTIEVESFSWGASNPGNMGAGGGGGTGKVSFQDIHFTAQSNKASPSLFMACASGIHIKKATLTVRKAGKDQQDYYKVTLSDILVSSYNSGGESSSEGDDTPTDSFSINFAKVEYSFAAQNSDGSLTDALSLGWDLQRNLKI